MAHEYVMTLCFFLSFFTIASLYSHIHSVWNVRCVTYTYSVSWARIYIDIGDECDWAGGPHVSISLSVLSSSLFCCCCRTRVPCIYISFYTISLGAVAVNFSYNRLLTQLSLEHHYAIARDSLFTWYNNDCKISHSRWKTVVLNIRTPIAQYIFFASFFRCQSI